MSDNAENFKDFTISEDISNSTINDVPTGMYDHSSSSSYDKNSGVRFYFY
jgi:hypothetical protein